MRAAETPRVSPSTRWTAVAGVLTASACAVAVAVTTPATASTRAAHPSGPPAWSHPAVSVPAGRSAQLPGTSCRAFPADDIWHADVSALPVNARSTQWLSHMQAASRSLHPDFGPSGTAVPYGIPYTVVAGTHAKVTVTFDYAAESDPVKYPLGADTLIEGGAGSGGDMHALVVDSSTCRLYETWDTRQSPGGAWLAGSGATWDLASNALRPAGWTSADAAGLPILPGLLRYDEVAAGSVDHAIRFTTNVSDRSYLWPARHQAGPVSDASYPPMGAWFRLKARYPETGLSPAAVAVVEAMKHHGMVLADNGSPWYFQGTADARWTTGLLDELKRIPAAQFEAIDVSSLQVSAGSGQVPAPVRGPVPHQSGRPCWAQGAPGACS